jgi:hypothetical protein
MKKNEIWAFVETKCLTWFKMAGGQGGMFKGR